MLGSIPSLLGFVPNPTPVFVILLSLLFPTFALTSAFGIFVAFETGFNGIQEGVSFQNINAAGPGQVSLLTLLITLVASTAIQIPLHFYLEKVLPSASASAISPLFFLSSSYWRPAPPAQIDGRDVPATERHEAAAPFPH